MRTPDVGLFKQHILEWMDCTEDVGYPAKPRAAAANIGNQFLSSSMQSTQAACVNVARMFDDKFWGNELATNK